jgi:predicted RNA binding protein YcfA (HicA-like mRNA interferase family)
MSPWPSVKAKKVLAALQSIGWQVKRQSGSHKTLARDGFPDFVFAFHDGEEIGSRMLSRVAKCTGLQPSDL